MNRDQISLYVWKGIFLFFLISFAILVATPINDPDFFWHLVTGRWIWEHKAIPIEDPFNFSTPPQARDLTRTSFILQSYWLGQLFMYGIYSISNYYGIVLLRVLMFTTILIFVFLLLRKNGVKIHSALIFLLLPAYILGEFVGDRPNQISFFMAIVTFYFIEEVRRGSKRGYFLPLIMALWSNIHGGFILGVTVILIYMFAETVKKIYMKLKGKLYKEYWSLILLLSISLMSGFLNPQGYNAFFIVRDLTPFSKTISEAQSPITIMRVTKCYIYLNVVILCSILSFVHVILSIRKKTINLAHLLFLSFLIFLSYTSIRYIPFLGLFITPVIAHTISSHIERLIAKIERYGIAQICLCSIIFISLYLEYKNTVLMQPLISQTFPMKAVKFIKEQRVEGNIFNFLDFGGYLEWIMYPKKITFIDGRNLVPSIYTIHDDVMQGSYGWNYILESYRVKNILIPAVTRTGITLGLTYELYQNEDWKLIYGDASALLFSKDESVEGLPKNYVLAHVITAANSLTGGDNPLPYISVAKALEYLSRKNDAIIYIEEAIKYHPSLANSRVARELHRLKYEVF